MEWQSIEMAPKDGSYIISLVKGFLPTIAWWAGNEWTNDRQEKDRAFSKHYAEQHSYAPTHWLPLPLPPTE